MLTSKNVDGSGVATAAITSPPDTDLKEAAESEQPESPQIASILSIGGGIDT